MKVGAASRSKANSTSQQQKPVSSSPDQGFTSLVPLKTLAWLVRGLSPVLDREKVSLLTPPSIVSLVLGAQPGKVYNNLRIMASRMKERF